LFSLVATFEERKKECSLLPLLHFTFTFHIRVKCYGLYDHKDFFFINCDGTHHFMFEMDLKKEDE